MSEGKIRGIIQALRELIKALENMERKGMTERTGSGEITGRWYTAKYGYRTKLGIESKDFTRPYRKPPAGEKPQRTKKSVKVVDRGNKISIVARLPRIKEEDLNLKIDDNKLKVVAKMGKNEIKTNIPVELDVQKLSFKNNLLMLELNKKGKGKLR